MWLIFGILHVLIIGTCLFINVCMIWNILPIGEVDWYVLTCIDFFMSNGVLLFSNSQYSRWPYDWKRFIGRYHAFWETQLTCFSLDQRINLQDFSQLHWCMVWVRNASLESKYSHLFKSTLLQHNIVKWEIYNIA